MSDHNPRLACPTPRLYLAPMNNGWLESAEAWIAAQGDEGDWSRRHVLDAPMLSRVVACNPQDVIAMGAVKDDSAVYWARKGSPPLVSSQCPRLSLKLTIATG